MTITVYGRKNCIACRYTTRFLDKENITYTYVDVDKAHGPKLPAGIKELPHVVTPHEDWSGFRIEKLKALAFLVADE